jgi:hypothetical protein
MITLPNKKSTLAAWHIHDQDFPHHKSVNEQLTFLLNYAILAPSSHNSQPWRFRVHDRQIDLYADRTRALPIVDPNDRELFISCGAALYTLRLAMHHFNYSGHITTFPDPSQPHLLATIRLGDWATVTEEEEALFAVIPDRHTHRVVFSDEMLPPTLLSDLRKAAAAEETWLHIIAETGRDPRVDWPIEEERIAISCLIAEGDRDQMANPEFRAELAKWLRSSQASDGMPGYSQGFNENWDFTAPLMRLIVRTFDMGDGQAIKDSDFAYGAPALAVLGSEQDTPQAWLMVGQALQRILLLARSHHVWASFLNQPIEVPELRTKLQGIIEQPGYPQILLRFGYTHAPIKPTPRRPLTDVLIQ